MLEAGTLTAARNLAPITTLLLGAADNTSSLAVVFKVSHVAARFVESGTLTSITTLQLGLVFNSIGADGLFKRTSALV